MVGGKEVGGGSSSGEMKFSCCSHDFSGVSLFVS